MINSKVLHRFQSESDAITPNFLFNPSFISPAESLIYEKYVNPVLSSSMEYIIFQKDIASSAAISTSSALHLFHSEIKMTPINYLISYRLKQAALLLTNTEKKIATIAHESGFNGVDHFCRSFKNSYGITPTDYRKQSGKKYLHTISSHPQ